VVCGVAVPTDKPRYTFEGTNATTSQRATRGVLAMWDQVNTTGEDITGGAAAKAGAYTRSLFSST